MVYTTRMKDENLSTKLRCGPGCGKRKHKHCSCCHRTSDLKELKVRSARQLRRSNKQIDLEKLDGDQDAL